MSFGSDLRVRVQATGLTTYPDVTVVCGPTARDRDSRTTVANPTVLFEVTSASTEEYDRIEKLEHYRRIPALAAYVIVSHREPRLTVWHRSSPDASWTEITASTDGVVTLAALGCSLSVDAVYGGILAGV